MKAPKKIIPAGKLPLKIEFLDPEPCFYEIKIFIKTMKDGANYAIEAIDLNPEPHKGKNLIIIKQHFLTKGQAEDKYKEGFDLEYGENNESNRRLDILTKTLLDKKLWVEKEN